MKNKIEEDDDYSKTWLIREIASRAGFTISDVRIIWKTFEEIFYEVLKTKGSLSVGGLFNVSVTEIAPHMGWDAHNNVAQLIDTCYRIRIKASPTMKKILFWDEEKRLSKIQKKSTTTPIDNEEVEL
jgi:hypothetical protein